MRGAERAQVHRGGSGAGGGRRPRGGAQAQRPAARVAHAARARRGGEQRRGSGREGDRRRRRRERNGGPHGPAPGDELHCRRWGARAVAGGAAAPLPARAGPLRQRNRLRRRGRARCGAPGGDGPPPARRQPQLVRMRAGWKGREGKGGEGKGRTLCNWRQGCLSRPFLAPSSAGSSRATGAARASTRLLPPACPTRPVRAEIRVQWATSLYVDCTRRRCSATTTPRVNSRPLPPPLPMCSRRVAILVLLGGCFSPRGHPETPPQGGAYWGPDVRWRKSGGNHSTFCAFRIRRFLAHAHCLCSTSAGVPSPLEVGRVGDLHFMCT